MNADGLLKVLPRDFAIFVMVKLVEDLLELIGGKVEAPMLENVFEFIVFYQPVFFNVQVSEGFLQSGPL